jgi:hypothetical protein
VQMSSRFTPQSWADGMVSAVADTLGDDRG